MSATRPIRPRGLAALASGAPVECGDLAVDATQLDRSLAPRMHQCSRGRSYSRGRGGGSVPWFDLNENELRQYRITTREPDGLDTGGPSGLPRRAKWRRRRPFTDLARRRLVRWRCTTSNSPGPHGDPIHAWFVSPPGVAARSTPVAVTLWGTAAAAACPLSISRCRRPG
jgi:hypothetical protein